LLLVHQELCWRAAIEVAWTRVPTTAYLTVGLGDPDAGAMDAFLRPFVVPIVGQDGDTGRQRPLS